MVQHKRSILVCSLIFLTFVGWVKSGETKCVSAGDTRLLFPKSDTSNICSAVFLYANGSKENKFICSWKWENGTFKETSMTPDYKRTIVVDRDGNILILSVNISDAGNYILQCDNQKIVSEVQLKLSDELTECQHDAAFMKKHSENLNKEQLMQIQYRLEDVHKTCGSSDGMLISILVLTILVPAVIFIICYYLYRQNKNKNVKEEETIPLEESDQMGVRNIEAFKEKQTIPITETCQLWTQSFGNLKGEQKLQFQEICQKWMKHFEYLIKMEILPWLNHNREDLEKFSGNVKKEQSIIFQESEDTRLKPFDGRKCHKSNRT